MIHTWYLNAQVENKPAMPSQEKKPTKRQATIKLRMEMINIGFSAHR